MVSGVDAVASMGDGILALENDRVALPGWSHGAPCTVEFDPWGRGNYGQFYLLDFQCNFGVLKTETVPAADVEAFMSWSLLTLARRSRVWSGW